ncbi:MAG: IPT/TIG domain-containing protein [Planctomycetes bacterium]|nr:IPT/TIG domain-containing protein [Planctomycetota bacterium]
MHRFLACGLAALLASCGGRDAGRPPSLASVSPASGPAAGGTTLELAGSGFETGAAVAIGGVPARAVAFVRPDRLRCETPPGKPGPVAVSVLFPDGRKAVLLNAFRYESPFHLSSVSPARGPSRGGTPLEIEGGRLQREARVFVGSSECAGYDYSGVPARISCRAPAGPPGRADVEVRNPDGTSAVMPKAFTFTACPAVKGVAPIAGPARQAVPVTVTGADFQSGASVSFGGRPAGDVVVANAATIACVTPPLPPGPVEVRVTNPDGQSGSMPAAFTARDVLRVDSVSPASGPMAGGIRIAVRGEGFQAGAEVLLGGRPAADVQVVDGNAITCTTPAGEAGTARVEVRNPDAASAVLPGGFAYLDRPVLLRAEPASGPSSGGTRVRVLGSGFREGATLRFGGSAASEVDVRDPSSATCLTPAHPAGAVEVSLSNPDGSAAALEAGFRFVAPPAIDSVSPDRGPEDGGGRVVLSGTGFQAGASVSIGGTPCADCDGSEVPARIACRVPPGPSGRADVEVRNPDGQSCVLRGGYLRARAPVLSSVSPERLPSGGGCELRLEGTGFAEGGEVFVGGRPASGVRLGGGGLACVAPWGEAGSADVEVRNPDGGSATRAGACAFEANRVLRFDGRRGLVDCGPAPGADAPASFTVEAWVRLESAVRSAPVALRTDGRTAAFGLEAAFRMGQAQVDAGGRKNLYTRANLPLGAWAHLAAVWDGTELRFYVNGVPDSSRPVSGSPAPLPAGRILVGSSGPASGAFLHGRLDEVRISSGPRYRGPFAPAAALAADADTVLLLRGEAGEGTLLRDESASGAHGTPTDGVETAAEEVGIAPAVASVSPASGPRGGGTALTIRGSGFMAGATVRVGGAWALRLRIVDSTTLTCAAPPGAPGAADVEVVNPGGLAAAKTAVFLFE